MILWWNWDVIAAVCVESHELSAAAAEHGLRIMAMLYLTPILPLGPVSYMCGTTSMALSSFVIAKVASLPLMFFYVFIGASTGALVGKKEVEDLEGNEYMIVSGILLSLVMIAGITRYIKKELNRVCIIEGLFLDLLGPTLTCFHRYWRDKRKQRARTTLMQPKRLPLRWVCRRLSLGNVNRQPDRVSLSCRQQATQ